MSQLAQKHPSQTGYVLSTTTYVAIPGLAIALLTGAGWINVRARIQVGNTYAGPNPLTLVLSIDSVTLLDSPGAFYLGSIAQALHGTAYIDYTIRLGAGQHTFSLYAKAGFADLTIDTTNASLLVEELGY